MLIWITQHAHKGTIGGDKVSMLTHTYPRKPPRNIKVTICNHQAESPNYLWPDFCSGDLQAQKAVWLYLTPNGLTETRCHKPIQNQNQTKLTKKADNFIGRKCKRTLLHNINYILLRVVFITLTCACYVI